MAVLLYHSTSINFILFYFFYNFKFNKCESFVASWGKVDCEVVESNDGNE